MHSFILYTDICWYFVKSKFTDLVCRRKLSKFYNHMKFIFLRLCAGSLGKREEHFQVLFFNILEWFPCLFCSRYLLVHRQIHTSFILINSRFAENALLCSHYGAGKFKGQGLSRNVKKHFCPCSYLVLRSFQTKQIFEKRWQESSFFKRGK